MSRHVGSVEVGKLADLVLWTPAFFGVKPDLVLKGGVIAAAPMGDPNASIPTPQPVHYRPMFGGYGAALTAASLTFVSRAALDKGLAARLRTAAPARGGREHARRHLQDEHGAQRRDAGARPSTPRPTGSRPTASILTCEPAAELPMAQRYFLF